MYLTIQEFNNRLENGKLMLSLVGMSGMGKSYWSQQLTSIGFNAICCDDLIEQRLENLPAIGIAGVAEWMGQPYSKNYHEHQQEYLQHEAIVTQGILKSSVVQNTIIDTTGSVIYIPASVIELLQNQSLIVYLESTLDHQALLFERYKQDPKPVVWGNMYSQEPHETPQAALERCYPKLLHWRSQHYAIIADVTLTHESIESISTPQEFMKLITNRLPL